MRRFYFYIIAALAAVVLDSCWEDRSWQYYEKVQTKTWMYEMMQQNYLFHEDLPALKKDDKIFFKQPNDFLRSVASKKDGKGGYIFSHVDSIRGTARTMTDYPSFGYEAQAMNVRFPNELVPAIRVLYVQKNSPAERSGMKRGDWIVAVDSMPIKSEMLSEYIDRPTRAHEFMFAEIKADQSGFDTLENSKVLTPEPVDVENILTDGLVKTGGGHTAYYILYNEFGEDVEAWNALLGRMKAAVFDDVIVDLRYNPGGYLSMLQYMGTNLVPAEYLGQPFVRLLPNEDFDVNAGPGVKLFNFEKKMLAGDALTYRNLYVIASLHSASASEAFINCLRPYMEGRMFHVGTNTFGKNMAQSRFVDDKQAPGLEFWMTTHYVANKDNYYDYYTHGLQPDFMKVEDLVGELGALGTPADSLMQPVLYHMDNGCFETAEEVQQTSRVKSKTVRFDMLYNTVDKKRRTLHIE